LKAGADFWPRVSGAFDQKLLTVFEQQALNSKGRKDCKDALHPVDEAQLLSHLRLLDIPVGLLINFHIVQLRDGIPRMVNKYCEEEAVEQETRTAKLAKNYR